ncbi:hypothetical protein SFR_1495 [Streptomyces sp. FR-008]|nr:hypothetical protein SFR_1495 [Streptomyces sp. FR-008]
MLRPGLRHQLLQHAPRPALRLGHVVPGASARSGLRLLGRRVGGHHSGTARAQPTGREREVEVGRRHRRTGRGRTPRRRALARPVPFFVRLAVRTHAGFVLGLVLRRVLVQRVRPEGIRAERTPVVFAGRTDSGVRPGGVVTLRERRRERRPRRPVARPVRGGNPQVARPVSRPVALRAGGPVRTVPGLVRRAGRAGRASRVAPASSAPRPPERPPENGATPPLEEASAVYQASALKVYSPVVSAADSTSA